MTYRDFSADLRTIRLLAGARRASRSPIARLLLAGTALGCTLLPASHAAAQVVREQSADGSPIVIQSGTIVAPDGTGAGIEATTTGAITITSADVTTASAAGHGIVANGGTGAVQIDSGTVRTSGAGAYGVTASTSSGGIRISSDEILTTGSGQVYGISAVTGGGSIAIESGVVNVASSGSNNARGIVANSGGGDITIDAGTTTGHSRAIFTTTLFSGPELGFTAGNTRITSESAIATGGNAIIGQGYSVALTSGRAEGTANPDFTAATIYVSAGEGGATLTAGETIGHGYGQYGIQTLSTGALSITSSSVTTDGVFGNGITATGSAAMVVDSGSVATAGDNSHGIVAQAYTRYSGEPVSITSDTIATQGRTSNGIFVQSFEPDGGMTGDITIDSGSIETSGQLSHGIVVAASADPGYAYRPVSATAGTGALSVTSDSIVASGPGGRGIVFDHAGAISLTSGTIDAQAGGIYMWAGSTVDITSGDVTTAGGPGIVVYGATGDVTLDAGSTEVGANGDAGIYVETTTGNVSITADRTVTNSLQPLSGFTADGISGVSSAGGNVSIDSGVVSVKGESAFGIYGSTTGLVDIASDQVSTAGASGIGIYAGGSAGVTIDSGSVVTLGSGAHGIRARSANGEVAITSASIRTEGANAAGIFVPTSVGGGAIMAGDITIDSGSIETAGQLSHGIVVAASADPGYAYRPVSASAGTGALSVTSDSIVASGPGGRGIVFDHAGAISLTSGTIDAQAGGIYMWAGSTVDITSGDVTTAGGPGIVVYGGAGDVTLDAGSTEVGANGDVGIYIETTSGNVSITADRTVTNSLQPGGGYTADGISGVSSAGGNVSIDSGIVSVKGESAFGIYGSTTGLVSIASDQVSTAGTSGIGIYAGGSAGVTIDSGSVVTLGSGAYGIRARSANGEVAITSASIRTEGANAAGIFVPTSVGGGAIMGGDITIDSGTIATSGANSNGISVAASASPAYGMRPAQGGTGALAITSDAIETSGANSWGIAVDHRGPIAIDSSTIRTQAGAGIYVWAEDLVTIKSGTIETPNGPGIVVYGGAGDVDITSGTATVGTGGDVGVWARTTTGDIKIVAGTTTTARQDIFDGQYTADGVTGISAGGGSVTIEAGTTAVVGESAYGVTALTTGLASVTSGTVTTAGANGVGIYARGDAGVSVRSGDVTTTGSAAHGIQATAATGGIAIASTGTIAVSGAGAAGVRARTTSGAIDATVSSVTAAGGAAAIDLASSAGGDMRLAVNGSVAASGPGKFAGVQLATTGTSTVSVAVGASVTGSGSGIVSQRGTLVLDNAGTIRGDGARANLSEVPEAGVRLQSAGAITNSGSISGRNYGVVTTQLPVSDPGGGTSFAWFSTDTQITNSGRISADEDDAIAIYGGGTVRNSGTIQSGSGATADGIQLQWYPGVDSGMAQIGTIANEAGGSIAGTRYGIILAGGGTIANAGSIEGGTAGVLLVSQNFAGKEGVLTNSGTIRTNNGTGVLFDLATATLTNSGTIDAGGIGVDVTGAFTANNSGRIVSAGTAIRAAQAATIGNSGTITSNGGVAVMLAQGGTVVNTGTIFAAEAALAASGAVTLDNAGVLGSNSGIAAVLSAGNDTLVLRTGSAITGLVDGGDGQDVATLIGTSAQPSQAQQIGRLDNFEGLNVANGYWSTTGYVGEFQNVQIAADGALQVNEVPGSGGDAAIDTLDVVNNGLLLFNFTSDVAVDAESPLAVSGTGAVALIGTGTVEVATDTLTHTGGTLVANGTLLLTGSLPGDVTTTGAGRFVLTDSAGFSGTLVNDGTFVFARTGSYDFAGDFSGSGLLEKQGEGVLTFAGDYSFVGKTNVLGGSVKFAGQIDPETEFDLTSGTLDLSSQDQTIGGLAGTQQSTVALGSSQLTVNQTESSVFAGAITGSGGLTLAGGGLLNLTGNSTYTGTTTVQQGTLKVNGSIVAPVVINAGGVLGGNGSVGNTTVGGGRIGPGNSIGRLSVAGDLAFGAGSVYEVEVNAAGGADRIDVAGVTTIASTARVEVLAENGNYRPLTEYTILTSAGGISGTFGSVTSNLAFLTPRLRYASNAVTLNLYRNDIDFAAVATGANQVAVGNAVEALGPGNGLYEEVLVQSAAGARSAYDALAGEINATTSTALIDESRYLRDAVLSAAPPEDTAGMFLIGSVFGGWGEIEGRGGLAAADIDHKGVLAGLGYAGQGVSVGIAGSVGRSTHQLEARSGRSMVDTASVAGFVGYAAGGLEAKAGASFGWHQIDANRSAVVGAVGSDLHSGHDATTRQLFGGVAFDLVSGELDLAPFARIANIRVHHDGYAEAGGPAALTIAERSQDVTLLTLGADARIPLTPGVKAKLSGGWQHGWGDLAAATDNRFAGSASGFRITGAALPKDSALVDAGIEADLQGFRLGVSYVGSYASGWTDHGARATVSINF